MTSEYKKMDEIMGILARNIDKILNHYFGRKGFALLVFDFHQSDAANFVSNARREDMVTALRETADRLENNQDIPVCHPTTQ